MLSTAGETLTPTKFKHLNAKIHAHPLFMGLENYKITNNRDVTKGLTLD